MKWPNDAGSTSGPGPTPGPGSEGDAARNGRGVPSGDDALSSPSGASRYYGTQSGGRADDWMDARVEAYIDDELSAEEAAAFERAMEASAYWQEQVRRAERIADGLRHMPQLACPEHVTDAVMRHVAQATRGASGGAPAGASPAGASPSGTPPAEAASASAAPRTDRAAARRSRGPVQRLAHRAWRALQDPAFDAVALLLLGALGVFIFEPFEAHGPQTTSQLGNATPITAPYSPEEVAVATRQTKWALALVSQVGEAATADTSAEGASLSDRLLADSTRRASEPSASGGRRASGPRTP